MTVKCTRRELEAYVKHKRKAYWLKPMPNVELLIVRFLSESSGQELSRRKILQKLQDYQGIPSFDADKALAILRFERIVKQTSDVYRLSDNYEVKLRSYVQNYPR